MPEPICPAPSTPIVRISMGVRLITSCLVVLLSACAAPNAIDRAQQQVRMHREGEAIATLRAELGKHPDDVPARRLLVRVLAVSGDLDTAKREVQELEARLPNDPIPWIEMGHAYELAH